MPGWLSKDLLEFWWKKTAYGHSKWGQVTWEDYNIAAHYCREIICAAKAQLELKLTNKKDFLKYVNCKRRTRENIAPLFDEGIHLRSRDIDKADIQCLLYLCLQQQWWALGPRQPWYGGLTAGTINSQPTLKLCRICCSTWMYVSLLGPKEFF